MPFLDVVLVFGAFVRSLAVHEGAHAGTALPCSDPTRVRQGRLSRNPAAHPGPVRSVPLPFRLQADLVVSSGVPVRSPFGDAEPGPYNPCRARSPARTMNVVAVPGPLSKVIGAGHLPRSGVRACFRLETCGFFARIVLEATGVLPRIHGRIYSRLLWPVESPRLDPFGAIARRTFLA